MELVAGPVVILALLGLNLPLQGLELEVIFTLSEGDNDPVLVFVLQQVSKVIFSNNFLSYRP